MERMVRILSPLLKHPDYEVGADPEFFSQNVGGVHSPLYLPDLEQAVAYLKTAIDKRQHILILGDRDVDGVSSTALLGSFLKKVHLANDSAKLTSKVSDDGDDYGLSGSVFDTVRDSGADLIFLLDMGTSNGPEIDTLVEGGARVIVLDHHQPHSRIPDNELCAFVNPLRSAIKQEHAGKIATVGLVFKLLMGYGLSYTKDWQRAYYVNKEASEMGDKGGFIYRLGRFQGDFPNQAAAQKYAQEEELEFINSDRDSEIPFNFDNQDRERMLNNPDEFGRVVLGKQVRARTRLAEFVMELSDLAAVGLVTDMVPLVGENRAIVRMGLGLAGYEKTVGQRAYRCGYDALMTAIGLRKDRILSRDLGWSIGPALNAAGRMGKTAVALELLIESDKVRARDLAREIVNLNEERKLRTRRNEVLVTEHLKANPEKTEGKIIFCYHPDLESGVSGIVAARLTETYRRPAVYINPEGEHAKGSARAFKGENVLELLDRASDLFVQFGGHREAAGFTVAYDDIEKLEAVLQEAALDVFDASKLNQTPQVEYQMELTPRDMGPALLEELELFEPFGVANPEPVFRVSSVYIQNLKFLSDGKHVKFSIQGASAALECVAWGKGAEFKELALDKPLHLYGSMEWNYFRGRSTPQFRLEAYEAVT